MKRPTLSVLLLVGFTTAVYWKPSSAQQRAGSDSHTQYVRVSVTDKRGRAVAGLSSAQFRVYENNNQLALTSFAATEPAVIALLLDLSGSMKRAPQKMASDVIEKLLPRLPSDTEYVVIAFHEKSFVVCETCNRNQAVEALQRISQFDPHFNTSFYDACDLAVRKLEAGKRSQRVLLAFSDGEDNSSKVSHSDLRNALKNSQLTFYAVSFYSREDRDSELGREASGILDDFAEISGGKTFRSPNESSAEELAEVLATQVNNSYLIGFKPSQDAADQKWHNIKVKLELPKQNDGAHFKLHYRARYYNR